MRWPDDTYNKKWSREAIDRTQFKNPKKKSLFPAEEQKILISGQQQPIYCFLIEVTHCLKQIPIYYSS